MPRKELNVPQAAAGAVDVLGGDGNEASASGMGRATLKLSCLESAANQFTTLERGSYFASQLQETTVSVGQTHLVRSATICFEHRWARDQHKDTFRA